MAEQALVVEVPSVTAPVRPRAAGGRVAHLWQIDIVRLATFTAVIAVHSLAFTEEPSDVVAAGAMMLLQFGREVFFAISGLVLVHAALGRSERPWRFWRRRVPAVLVPYATWTVVYDLLSGRRWSWSVTANHLLTGGAEYHLYFLVVTLQLYLVFPVLLRFVRATASHAVPVLAVVGLADLAWLGALQYATAPAGWGWLWVRGYELLPTYLAYVLAGCYVAVHRERVDAYVRSHGRQLLEVAAVAAAVALGAYAWQLGSMPPRSADAVLQPAMTASCVAAAITLYVLGLRWADRRPAGGADRAGRVVTTASTISFGVYLAHPLVLDLLATHGLGNGNQVVPAPAATLLALAGALVGASALSLVAVRTPLSLPLTGRRRLSRPGRRGARAGLSVSLAGTR